MAADSRYAFVTPTWRGDLEHFRLLRLSLECSPLAGVPHYVVVQTEDVDFFREFEGGAVRLLSTAEVLAPDVERCRRTACAISARVGRHWTRMAGSFRRTLGIPRWPAYTGWHTQQICKLALANKLDADQVVVLDSDVIVTPQAALTDFESSWGIACFATWQPMEELGSKVQNWVKESERLVGQAAIVNGQINTYFDTPFVLNVGVVRKLLTWLEATYDRRWDKVLLNQPPRRWSEFGIYKAFLQRSFPADQVDWRSPDCMRYLYDAPSEAELLELVEKEMQFEKNHYITLHSHSGGREVIRFELLAPALRDLILRQWY